MIHDVSTRSRGFIQLGGKPLSSAFWFTACIALGSGLLIATLGLDRPYDAIPDQDLLWLREALLMHQGKAPGYPDHPGIFWQVLYTLKLKWLSLSNPLRFGAGIPIAPDDANLIIRWARLENGILAGLTSLLLWPTLRQLGIQRWLTAISVITCCLCLGNLESAVQIRNELSSTFFLLAYLNIALLLPNLKSGPYCRAARAAAMACFLIAAYCKVQILILTPFVFVLILGRQYLNTDEENISRRVGPLSLQNLKAIAASLILGSGIWLIAVSGPVFASLNRFQHVRTEFDLPFWTATNALLILTTRASSSERNAVKTTWRVGLLYGAVTLLISRVLAYPVWTAQVFSFPSNALGFSGGDNRLVLLQEGIYKYLSDLFISSPSITLLVIAGLAISLLTQAIRSRQKPTALKATWLLCLLGLCCSIWMANAMRPRGFYELYLIIPALILLTLCISTWRTSSKRSMTAVFAITLIGLSLIQSVANVLLVPQIAQMTQPRQYLCFEQAFDQALSRTSIATCANYGDYIKRHS